MSAKILSESAFSIINQYKNFNMGFAVCNVPYYNNKRLALRGGLKVQVGKGSPAEIHEEMENIAAVQKINLKAVDSVTLKKILVDNNIGIDCSGLVYYILNEESLARGKGSLKTRIHFSNAKNIFRKITSKMNPEKNTDVATFAHDKNSRAVTVMDLQPGDMITMVGGMDGKDRDHVLVVHEVDYKDEIPVGLNYTHTVGWPSDGEYGHGVRQGMIRITDPSKLLTEQEWFEAERTGQENYTFTRACKSQTEIRRLNWL